MVETRLVIIAGVRYLRLTPRWVRGYRPVTAYLLMEGFGG